MKNIELINESIQKMANKPSEEAISAAQSIAKEMDDALAKGYESKWMCSPIIENRIVAVVDVGKKPKVVCIINDKDMFNEILDIFYGIDTEKMEKTQPQESWKFSDFIEEIRHIHYQ